MVYTGKYAYWMIEGTKLGADPSVDQNIPFNPMADLTPPKPRYVDAEFRTFDSLEPKKIWTEGLDPGENPLAQPPLFQDPFLLLTFFTHKTVGGVWGTGDGTISADFTANDDIDTIGVQYRNEDQLSTNHIDRLLKGGFPQKYSWVIEPGKLLKEVPEFKFVNFADNTQAPTINNNFHDQSFGSGVGGWAKWDNSGLGGSGKRSVVNFELKWGGAAITGLDILNVLIELELGSETIKPYSSLSHTVDWFKQRNFTVTLEGYVKDKTLIAEYEQIFDSRTKQNLTMLYDTTASYTKGLTSTQVYVSPESDVVPIAEAGDAPNVSVILKGGEDFALSFAGTWLDRPDPSALITTSP
jgi:hypothetical protein